jgi:hypothetical protein
MTPILVVGAGPVGLTMVAELSRFGISVRIIDRNTHPTETSRALVIWSRTLELMDRMGCTKAFLDAGLKAHGASLRAGQVVLGRPRFDDVASEYNFALMIPQPAPPDAQRRSGTASRVAFVRSTRRLRRSHPRPSRRPKRNGLDSVVDRLRRGAQRSQTWLERRISRLHPGRRMVDRRRPSGWRKLTSRR